MYLTKLILRIEKYNFGFYLNFVSVSGSCFYLLIFFFFAVFILSFFILCLHLVCATLPEKCLCLHDPLYKAYIRATFFLKKKSQCLRDFYLVPPGWSGGAKVLGKLPVPGRPTILITVEQGPTALAVGAGGGCLDIFTLIYLFSSLSPSLWETARYRLKYCLKGPLNPKQPTNQST